MNKDKFIYIQILSFIFFFPLIYGGGYNYSDDIVRAISGYYGWSVSGRNLAYYVAKLYSFGNDSIIDPMPFGYIFNIFIIGCASYLIYLKFKEKYNQSAFIIAALFIVNPFLVENLLFRYDSIGMVLALFFVVFAFSLQEGMLALIIKTLSLLVSLNFYQTFSNLYLGLVAVEILLFIGKNNNYRNLLRFILLNLLVFLSANILYFIELKIIGISSRGEMLPIDSNLPYLLGKNIFAAFKPFITFWSFSPKFILILLPFLAFSLIKEITKHHHRILLGVLISSVFILFSGIGFMSILKEQFLEPRGLSYFPVILMASAIIIRLGSKYAMLAMCIPVFACVIFVSRVGNMQAVQSKFEEPILFSASRDIQRLSSQGVTEFYSRGGIPLSNYILNIVKATPFDGFTFRYIWTSNRRITEYTSKNLKFESPANRIANEFNPKKEGVILAIDNAPFYNIYTDGNKGWIIWGRGGYKG